MANGSVITIHGVSKFTDSLKHHSAAASEAARNIVSTGALLIASEAKRQFRPRPGGQRTSQKSGKTYYVFTPPYQAVPPQPTSRSGALQTSIGKFYRITKMPAGWKSEIGPTVNHAPYVEFGTSRMQKEPYMATGISHSRGAIERLAEAEWAKAAV
jgi:hypothetical protein